MRKKRKKRHWYKTDAKSKILKSSFLSSLHLSFDFSFFYAIISTLTAADDKYNRSSQFTTNVDWEIRHRWMSYEFSIEFNETKKQNGIREKREKKRNKKPQSSNKYRVLYWILDNVPTWSAIISDQKQPFKCGKIQRKFCFCWISKITKTGLNNMWLLMVRACAIHVTVLMGTWHASWLYIYISLCKKRTLWQQADILVA